MVFSSSLFLLYFFPLFLIIYYMADVKYKNNIALYICDSSDGRQDLRKRKFDEWYDKHEDPTKFAKMNEVLFD